MGSCRGMSHTSAAFWQGTRRRSGHVRNGAETEENGGTCEWRSWGIEPAPPRNWASQGCQIISMCRDVLYCQSAIQLQTWACICVKLVWWRVFEVQTVAGQTWNMFLHTNCHNLTLCTLSIPDDHCEYCYCHVTCYYDCVSMKSLWEYRGYWALIYYIINKNIEIRNYLAKNMCVAITCNVIHYYTPKRTIL